MWKSRADTVCNAKKRPKLCFYLNRDFSSRKKNANSSNFAKQWYKLNEKHT